MSKENMDTYKAIDILSDLVSKLYKQTTTIAQEQSKISVISVQHLEAIKTLIDNHKELRDEVVSLAQESFKRDILLARLEKEVEYMRDNISKGNKDENPFGSTETFLT